MSLLVANYAKSHTITENLIIPAAKAMITIILGEKAAKDLNLISLSNGMAEIESQMCENIKDLLIEHVKQSFSFIATR